MCGCVVVFTSKDTHFGFQVVPKEVKNLSEPAKAFLEPGLINLSHTPSKTLAPGLGRFTSPDNTPQIRQITRRLRLAPSCCLCSCLFH